jgi:UDP-N-acetylmuramoylalanine-D-glutamate ligase
MLACGNIEFLCLSMIDEIDESDKVVLELSEFSAPYYEKEPATQQY